MTGRPRPAVDALPSYRPGKDAAQAEAEHGIENAIKLASNENPWGPVPTVAAALAEAIGGINRYADHRATALRAAIAEWIGVDVARVAVGCGSVGLLQQFVLSYVGPGEEVVYPWRSFEVYPVYTQLVDGSAITTPLVDETVDVDAVAEAVSERTKLVFIANPNNPTGTAVDMATIRRLLERVPRDVLVVLDEAYREFMDPSLGDPVVDLAGDFPHLVVLRTFSKAQGLAALRVGYCVAAPEVIDTLDKTLAPFAVNGLGQVGAIASIEAHDDIMQRVASLVDERRRVTAALRADGWSVPEPQANFVYLPTGDRTMELSVALEQQGVVTRPFAGEGLRVTVSTPEENDRFLAAVSVERQRDQ